MSKPNGDNRLTRDLLKLRPEKEPEFSLQISFRGPGFETSIEVKGERFAVDKALADFSRSIRDL